jgi:hypothetical protein
MRLNFTIATKKESYKLAGGKCAAHRIWPKEHCSNQINDYHHGIEASLGGKPTVDNCIPLCGKHHRQVTKERRPEMDKTVRLERKQRGWTGRKQKIKSRGFERWE